VNNGQINLAKSDIARLLLISSVMSRQVTSCHGCRLGFNQTGNSAIRSTGHGPRKHYPRTNIKWIGWPVAKIWPFKIWPNEGCILGPLLREGEIVGLSMVPFERAMVVSMLSIVICNHCAICNHSAQSWQWVTFHDPWPTWPIIQLTRDPHDPSPTTQSQTMAKSITTTHESWWVHDLPRSPRAPLRLPKNFRSAAPPRAALRLNLSTCHVTDDVTWPQYACGPLSQKWLEIQAQAAFTQRTTPDGSAVCLDARYRTT